MTLWRRSALGVLILMILFSCATTSRPTPLPDPTPRPLTTILPDVRSRDPVTRANAVSDLWHYGPAAAPAVPDLLALIDDPLNSYGGHVLNAESRVSVMEALGAIGPAAMTAAPTLVTIAQEPKEHRMVRSAAISALGKLADRSVVPALIPVLRDPDPILTQNLGLTIEDLVARDFPNDDGHSWQNAEGQSVIAVAVLAWWEREGQYLDWEQP